MKRKTLPVGTSDFKTLISEGFYYIDKSLLIKEIVDKGDRILLIPRPRRFGKTLNMSMLRYFFEKNILSEEQENRKLFDGLSIEKAGIEYMDLQGKFPLIYFSFKDIKQNTFEKSMSKLKSLIQEEYLKHSFLTESRNLHETEKAYFKKIYTGEGKETDYESSLNFLLRFLYLHYNEKVVILIDEYDAPIQAGYAGGYYEEIVSFMRNFLSGGLKDTDAHLQKGVLTGIMRVGQESIFSGLNNPGVFTILSQSFSQSFGFTEAEVIKLLGDYGLTEETEAVRRWYNGYRFGDTTVYNPWSIIQFASRPEDGLQPYWVNTSDNKLIEELLVKGGYKLKQELSYLLEGAKLTKPITSDIIFPDLKKSEDLLWSFLFFGGYLKQEGKIRVASEDHYDLSIPNEEVKVSYHNLIKRYFSSRMENQKVQLMLKALIEGKTDIFEEIFSDLVLTCLSYYDTPEKEAENVYHAFTAGLLVWLTGSHQVKSNRESGYGRFDIMLIPLDKTGAGIIIEFKVVRPKETLKSATEAAFKQIKEKKYETELKDLGIGPIRKLAIVFEGKKVVVKERTD